MSLSGPHTVLGFASLLVEPVWAQGDTAFILLTQDVVASATFSPLDMSIRQSKARLGTSGAVDSPMLPSGIINF